jgi:undecaprenyl-diphosphatase
MDEAITRWINAAAGESHILDLFMTTITQYGVPLLVVLVAIQWWSSQERLHVRHVCVAAGLSFLSGLALNQLILLFIHRARPYDVGISHLIISPSSDSSFPSDHATATLAIASTFLLGGLRRRGLGLLICALFVCWSRIYVGTHYFTDVLGGAATGLLAALAVRVLYREGTRLDRLITGLL